MKIACTLLTLLGMTLLMTPSASAADLKVNVVGVSVALKNKKSPFNSAYVNSMRPGVQLGMLVQSKQRKIVNIVISEKKPIKVLAGDKQLGAKENNAWHMFSPNIDDSGLWATLDVGAEEMPPKGTTKLSVTGELIVSTGNKTAEDKADIKFAKGTTFKLAGIDMKITESGKPSWGDDPLAVSIQTNNPDGYEKMQSVDFYDAAGKKIESKGGGTSTMTMNGFKSVTTEYRFKKVIKAATIKATYYSDLEKKNLPVELEVGLGL